MRKGLLSLSVWVALSSFGVAGGDLAEVEPLVPVAPLDVTQDQDHWYVGAGLIYNRTYANDSGWFDDKVLTQDETGGLAGIIGYEYNRYIAVEGRISKSFLERNYADVTIWSIFLKPQYQFRDDAQTEDGFFTVYGLIGFGNTYVEGCSGDNKPAAWPDDVGKEIMNETGFQWGMGLSYTFIEKPNENHPDYKDTWSIFVDYVVLAKDASINSRLYDYDKTYYKELNTDGITAGVTYKF